ncbi:MAG: zinc-ribbon domain-containing protein [Methanoregula sp.]|jgi:hypothetical protein
MDDPEMRGDEKILVRTQAIHVKSMSFEGILTNKRIILIDRIKNLLPPKEIPLATVKEVEGGENAIRELTLILSVIGKTGDVRQMILTFSRASGGNRLSERDTWLQYIREYTSSSFEQVIRKVIPGPGPAAQTYTDNARVPPAPPAPEPASPGFVLGTFCTKCGNQVPENSEFCNKCGARVVLPDSEPPAYSSPQPAAAPVAGRQHRPIDHEIQTIEPLIKKSSVKAPSDPLRAVPNRPAKPAAHVEITPADIMGLEENAPFPGTPGITPPARAPIAGKPSKPSARRFIPRLFSPKDLQPTPLVPGSMPTAPPAKPLSPRKSGRGKMLYVAIAVIVIIIIAAAAVMVLPKLGSGSSVISPSTTPKVTGTVTGTVTQSVTAGPAVTIVRAEPTPLAIPATGVYVYVDYLGGWTGTFGPAADLQKRTDSGERMYEVENATGSIQASFWKLDGSSHEITVAIYKDGKELTKGVTSASKGKVTLSADVTTGVALPPVVA